jgi:hypothetical protein
LAEKSDASEIRAKLAARDAVLNLGARQWWLKFAFHVTDVRNAAGILGAECLHCRATAIREGLMKVENADLGVIAKAAARTDTMARLYFRPRNPFHYDTEGCRPRKDRHHSGAHMPVPVFLLFHLADLLCTEGTLYTNGWPVSSTAVIRGDAAGLDEMNWKDIYSLGSMGTDTARKGELKFYRMAEILVPDSCPLTTLAAVICRTPSDRQTLLALLPEQSRDAWGKRIRLSQPDLFEGHWTSVRSVQWVGDIIVFTFSESTRPGPFDLRFDIKDLDSGRTLSPIKRQQTIAPPNLTFRINAAPYKRLYIELRLDDSLVYAHTLSPAALLTNPI